MQYIYRIYQKLDLILLNKYLHLSLFYILLFITPLILPGPQLLLGSLINFLLILGITQFSFKQIAPALFFPSIASYTYGLLFGTTTHFLLYLIPVIGIANILYVLIYKHIKKDYISVILASAIKAIFLFTMTLILNRLIELPSIFLSSMGIIQLVTVLTGGLIANQLVKIKTV